MDYQTIMNLWMYDFQNILENYSKIVEERKKEEEKQNEEYEKKYNMSPDKYMKQYSAYYCNRNHTCYYDTYSE